MFETVTLVPTETAEVCPECQSKSLSVWIFSAS